ncbi:MAG: ribosome biogenesis GTPase Der [Alphaproteobacteria bacterium]|nr:ribosome biogenesis GTPase Der [Alphaproteobacteria bacterium]
MKPRIVIVGRPNVGKSTLFNRLARRRLALVDDTPGVTRDRREAAAFLGGREVTLIDTAGLEEAPPETIAGRMRSQSERAVAAADLVLFVIDARAGVTPPDEHFAQWLRRQGRPVLTVANKAEGRAADPGIAEAWGLGFGEPVAVSAAHGDGVGALHAAIAAQLGVGEGESGAGEGEGEDEGQGEHEADAAASDMAENEGAEAEDTAPVAGRDRPLRLAIVGRPNAGKSTLLNRLLGEERVITGPEPGLTRDAIAVRWTDPEGREVELVDTAGMRRKARIEARLEQMSVGDTIHALRMAEVVVLVLDATLGLDQQDLTIARLVEREGRALVLAVNKWDASEDKDAARRAFRDRVESGLAQLKGVPMVFLSALTGRGVEKLLPAVWRVYEAWNRRVGTSALNRWLAEALARHPPPAPQGRRLKIRYATQVSARPPSFVLFGTRTEKLPEEYERYLANSLRESFGLAGIPIRIRLRSGRNPYASAEKRR